MTELARQKKNLLSNQSTNELVKGFKDSIGDEAEKREEIRRVLVGLFERYGFKPAETPVIEYEKFVKGDNKTDEAVSDIFKLQDKGKRKLALRYEFTFQLRRLMKNQKLPFKRYQIGPVFRDEPVTGNRFRQFIQCDADIIGSTTKDEAEILSLVKNVMKNLDINCIIYYNNRKLLNEILESLSINKKEEAIKIIDKLDKLPEKEVRKELNKINSEKALDIIKDKKKCQKFEAYKEIEELQRYLKYYNVQAEFLPSLARGLSYYNGTVFEIKTKEMKETITAGGSFMFNGVQSTGISFGLDRLAMLAKVKTVQDRILLVSLNQDKKAIELAQKLRNTGKNVGIFYGKPSKALEYANSYGIKKVVFVGAQEIKKRKFKIKNMQTGKEKILVLEKRSKGNFIVTK